MPQSGSLPVMISLDPGLDPVDALKCVASALPVPLLLESCLQRPHLGRYTFLAADPFETFRVERPEFGIDPFAAVRLRLQHFVMQHHPHAPPFQGGAAGLLGYELGRAWERLPLAAADPLEMPVAVIGLYDWVIAWDHALGTCTLVSQGFPESSPRCRRQLAAERAKNVVSLLNTARPVPAVRPPESTGVLTTPANPAIPVSNFSRTEYLSAVERVIEYIRAGDIFQANLSQQLTASAVDSPIGMYQRLRRANPATFGGFFADDDWAVVSSSPERFLRVQDGIISTRPIKGTRQRRLTPEADLFTRDELRESEKDRAENVMIVDLLRNDLSRVCRPGSIRVPELCTVETYETVTHLVSEVVGELSPGCTFWDAMAAAFPGGSITGAPKVRAMKIITELERVARGAYCGSLFYCGFDGWADSSILIRTMTQRRGQLIFPAGGGIVVRSDPAAEYQETLDKAAGMLRAFSP